ncbi:MAG: OmpA family protein [Thiotrichaceae bacterium]|nr:OmpA family protein [Thiotrichaceae bacterium]
MKYFITTLLLTSSLFSATQLLAQNSYLKDSSAAYVKNSLGECWITRTLPADEVKCGSMPEEMVATAEPEPAPEPVMAVAPVVTDEPVIKEVINLKGVTFKTGSDEINSSSYVRLNISAVDLVRNPELNVIVAGHTDNVGDSGFNRELSQKRAESVKAYLINKDIDASRLTARGFGDSEPATTNDTAEGRAKNRRVELRIH